MSPREGVGTAQWASGPFFMLEAMGLIDEQKAALLDKRAQLVLLLQDQKAQAMATKALCDQLDKDLAELDAYITYKRANL